MQAKPLTFLVITAIGIGAAALCGPEAQAVPITTLNNTGTIGGVAIVGTGVPDPNYSYFLTQSNPFPVTVDDTIWPIFGGPWVPNNGFSRWIGPAANSGGPAGNYSYETQFMLPNNADLNSVVVTGLWGTDDPSVSMLINGNLTPNVSAGFTSLVPFTINSGFQLGPNTIRFTVFNAGGPTGLRVDEIQGSFNRIPEPGTACLAAIALAGLLIAAGRRLRGPTA